MFISQTSFRVETSGGVAIMSAVFSGYSVFQIFLYFIQISLNLDTMNIRTILFLMIN